MLVPLIKNINDYVPTGCDFFSRKKVTKILDKTTAKLTATHPHPPVLSFLSLFFFSKDRKVKFYRLLDLGLSHFSEKRNKIRLKFHTV